MANGEVADVDKPLQKSPRLAIATRVSGSLASVLVREKSFKLETCVLDPSASLTLLLSVLSLLACLKEG